MKPELPKNETFFDVFNKWYFYLNSDSFFLNLNSLWNFFSFIKKTSHGNYFHFLNCSMACFHGRSVVWKADDSSQCCDKRQKIKEKKNTNGYGVILTHFNRTVNYVWIIESNTQTVNGIRMMLFVLLIWFVFSPHSIDEFEKHVSQRRSASSVKTTIYNKMML